MQKILVLHPGALGDLVLALPALASLRSLYPDSSITGLARLPVWKYSSLHIELKDLETSGFHKLFTGPNASVTGPADIVVTWMGKDDEDFVANLASSTGGKVMAGSIKPPSGGKTHAARHLTGALTSMDIDPEVFHVPLIPGEKDGQTADNMLKKQGIRHISKTLLIHPGSGSPAKCWPPEKFAEIAKYWLAENKQVSLIEGPADTGAVSGVLEIIDLPVLRGVSLGVLISLLGRCAAYLGNDSGVTHLAAASGADIVALFGPTDPDVWRPVGSKVKIITGDSSMEDIDIARVWDQGFIRRR